MKQIDENFISPVNTVTIADVGDGAYCLIVTHKGASIGDAQKVMLEGMPALESYVKMFFSASATSVPKPVETAIVEAGGHIGFLADIAA